MFLHLFSVLEAAVVSSYAGDDTIKIDLWMNRFFSPTTLLLLEIKTKLMFVVLGTKVLFLFDLVIYFKFLWEILEFDMTKQFSQWKAKVKGSR